MKSGRKRQAQKEPYTTNCSRVRTQLRILGRAAASRLPRLAAGCLNESLLHLASAALGLDSGTAKLAPPAHSLARCRKMMMVHLHANSRWQAGFGGRPWPCTQLGGLRYLYISRASSQAERRSFPEKVQAGALPRPLFASSRLASSFGVGGSSTIVQSNARARRFVCRELRPGFKDKKMLQGSVRPDLPTYYLYAGNVVTKQSKAPASLLHAACLLCCVPSDEIRSCLNSQQHQPPNIS